MEYNKLIKDYFDRKIITVADAAKKTGIPYSTLSSIKNRGTKRIDIDIMAKLAEAYPDLFRNDANASLIVNQQDVKDGFHKRVTSDWAGLPMFDIPVTAGAVSLIRDEPMTEPAFYLQIPSFRDCTFGARVSGDSMYPEIRNGDYVICKEVDKFIFGDIYLVVTDDGQETVKYVHPHEGDGKEDWVKLVPYNKSVPVTPIRKENIIRMYRVKGVFKGY